MAVVYLGLGSNVGNRGEYLHRATEKLRQAGMVILKTSSVIETHPVGGPPQGDFLNCVIQVETDLSPRELLSATSTIEQDLGRIRTIPNGPRTIDIDILLYDHQTIQEPNLIIPHPRMHDREFVMNPLREIAPKRAAQIKQ